MIPKSFALKPPTLVVHGGCEPNEEASPVVYPLYQSVNFVQPIGTGEHLCYPRYGNNPNAELVQKRLALLEGAEAGLVLASGMGATACALMALVRPGDHILASAWVYGGTYRLLTEELRAMGIQITLVNPFDISQWRQAISEKTRALFLETPINPTCRVVDLRAISALSQEAGVPLIVDSTFASPINLRPLEHGADGVIHSATKYLNGHHDVLAGVVLGSIPYIEKVRDKMIVWGQAPDPFACWLLERSLKTLDVRMQRHNENALRIARWCAEQRAVARVHYPGLESHPDHRLACSILKGFGGMMAIELAGGGVSAERFLRKLRLITHAPSLGGVDTLISEPRFTSHAAMPSEGRAACGVPDGFLRLSIGLEDPEDLIGDLEQALYGIDK